MGIRGDWSYCTMLIVFNFPLGFEANQRQMDKAKRKVVLLFTEVFQTHLELNKEYREDKEDKEHKEYKGRGINGKALVFPLFLRVLRSRNWSLGQGHSTRGLVNGMTSFIFLNSLK